MDHLPFEQQMSVVRSRLARDKECLIDEATRMMRHEKSYLERFLIPNHPRALTQYTSSPNSAVVALSDPPIQNGMMHYFQKLTKLLLCEPPEGKECHSLEEAWFPPTSLLDEVSKWIIFNCI